MVMNHCSANNCISAIITKGFCQKHYKRFLKYGDPEITARQRDGRSKHPLYSTWALMLDRCRNPKSVSYVYYGGRGIAVCVMSDIKGL